MLRFLQKHKFAVGLLCTGLGVQQFDQRVLHSSMVRSLRVFSGALMTTIDYKLISKDDPLSVASTNLRVAQRWFDICSKNGGLYIKLGQQIAMMNHVLPEEYLQIFSSLQDQAPYVSYEEVRKVFYDDWGKDPSEVFKSFDATPIASASIAQVHKAVLIDGTPVAVKIQKPSIAIQMWWDLWCYKIVSYLFEKAFDLPMYWAATTASRHVEMEADFTIEAMNTDRAKRDLAHMPQVHVPSVHWDHVSRRVLTLEWINGVKFTEAKKIEDMGFSMDKVMTTMIEAFAYQIFVSGFLHGDPHPGNVLVRPCPHSPSKHQVVILDHGLCTAESEEFRKQYCSFWKAVVLLDMPKIKEICIGWGIRQYELFATFQLLKPFNTRRAMHVVNTSRGDIEEMQTRMKAQIRNLLEDASKLPDELVIIGRAMNILRANNKRMGALVNRVDVMANYAVLGLEEDLTAVPGWGEWARRVYHHCLFRFNLMAIKWGFWLRPVWQKLGIESLLFSTAAKSVSRSFEM